jgi:hypothetical protein
MNAVTTGLYDAASPAIADIEKALAQAREEGAPDHASVYVFSGGVGPVFKVEWSTEVENPPAPPADTRDQPVQAEVIPILDPAMPAVFSGEPGK